MVEPYLFFNGQCEAAIEYYKQILGAEVTFMMRFEESPEKEMVTPENAKMIMHASLMIQGSCVMVSDGYEAGEIEFKGFSLSLGFDDKAAAEKQFDILAEEGKVEMPFAETFWSPGFGVVTDKFGVSWMVDVATEESAES